MKLEQTQVQVERVGEITESSFGISQTDQAHIVTILRDKLYSEKVYAVIREYSTNALDAHVQAGIPDRPIEVQLPNKFDLNFKVRDFGPGLSEQEVRELYVMYGASTRRTSNDVIGQLGLGCKSGFAYGNSFIVTSYFDGKKYIYNAYIDETNMGKIALMGKPTSTDEPNGIEITIPVRLEDVQAFRDKALYFYPRFKVRPVVRGFSEFDARVKTYDANIVLSGKSEYPGLKTTKWMLHSDSTNKDGAIAIMGNVPYPIKSDIKGLSEADKRLLQTNIVIEFDIGDVAVAASREALEYTTPTCERLRKRLESVHKVLADDLQTSISKAKNLLEAKRIYAQCFEKHSDWNLRQYLATIKRDLKFFWGKYDVTKPILETGRVRVWNARTKQHKDIEIDTKMYLCSETYKRRGTGMTFSISERSTISSYEFTQDNSPVVIVEVDTQDRWVRRTEALYQKLKVSLGKEPMIYAIKIDDKKTRKQLEIIFGYSNLNPTMISTIEPAKVSLSDGTSYRDKHQTSVFALDWSEIDRHHTVKSKYWKKAEADLKNDAHIYVQLDSFFIRLKHTKNPKIAHEDVSIHGLKEWLEVLKRIGVDIKSKTIYGIKSKQLEKIGPNWVRFEDFVFEQIRAHEAQHGEILAHKNKELALEHQCDNLDALVKVVDKVEHQNSALVTYIRDYIFMKGLTGISQKRTNRFDRADDYIRFVLAKTNIADEIKVTKDLNTLRQNAIDECPMFKAFKVFCDEHGHWTNNGITCVDSFITMFDVFMRSKQCHTLTSVDQTETSHS